MDTEAHQIEVEADDSRPTVTKSARGPGAARLRVEAAVLAAARHPGVVAVLDGSPMIDDDGTVRLRTRFAGSRTLATLGPVDVARAAGLTAALATTVADLHDLGICHGRITADHVIVAADGRPVLCGFAEAGRDGAGGPSPADDVAAIGRLLRDLVASTPERAEEPPNRRLTYRRQTGVHDRGALLNLADQATDDDPRRRPTARQLAAAIRTTVPQATLADDTRELDEVVAARRVSAGSWTDPEAGDGRRVPMLIGLCALVGFVAVGLAVLAVASRSAPSDLAAGAQPSPGPAVDTSMPVASTPLVDTSPMIDTGPLIDPKHLPEPHDPEPATPSPEPEFPFPGAVGCSLAGEGAPATTAAGAPCPTPMSLADGVLSLDGNAFRLGLDQPAITLGDFGCTGSIGLAVVDRTAGNVFVFEGWANSLLPVLANAVGRVEQPRQVLAEPLADGCHRLVVLDTWGLRHVMDLTPDSPQELQP